MSYIKIRLFQLAPCGWLLSPRDPRCWQYFYFARAMLYGASTRGGGVRLWHQLTGRYLLRITTNHRPADVQILIVFVYTFESGWALYTRFVWKSGGIDIQLNFIKI